MIAKETAYRQLIANTPIDMHRPQAKALQAEAEKLCAEFNKVYSVGAAQRSMAAPAATLGTGASTSASPPPRPALRASTTLVEMLKQKKERC